MSNSCVMRSTLTILLWEKFVSILTFFLELMAINYVKKFRNEDLKREQFRVTVFRNCLNLRNFKGQANIDSMNCNRKKLNFVLKNLESLSKNVHNRNQLKFNFLSKFTQSTELMINRNFQFNPKHSPFIKPYKISTLNSTNLFRFILIFILFFSHHLKCLIYFYSKLQCIYSRLSLLLL